MIEEDQQEPTWQRCDDCSACTYGINARCFPPLAFINTYISKMCLQGRKNADRRTDNIKEAILKRKQKTLLKEG